jgi:hypothetical protein
LLAFFIQSKLSLRKSSFVVPALRYPCAVIAQLRNTKFRLMVRSSSERPEMQVRVRQGREVADVLRAKGYRYGPSLQRLEELFGDVILLLLRILEREREHVQAIADDFRTARPRPMAARRKDLASQFEMNADANADSGSTSCSIRHRY